jgi:hypothetical protein
MNRARNTRSYFSQQPILSSQVDEYYKNILTISLEIQKRLEYLISIHEKEDCNSKCLLELNEKKTELITIMNDYLTKKTTRIETTNKLDVLNAKLA